MLAVVSPAKKLDTDTIGRQLPFTQPSLLDDTEQLMVTTKRLKAKDLRALMGISEKLAELNHARFQAFETPFTEDNAKAAALMFNGDTYTGLDASSLSDTDLTWAQDHLAILSGLYGILRPLDLIQPYRLEMGTRLKTRRGPSLYAFWGDRICRQIENQLQSHTNPTLVNLASNEYFKSVQAKTLQGSVLTPAFKEMRDGKAKMISFMAKRARGMMARYIIENRIDEPEALKEFTMGGYEYAPSMSDESTWTFIR
jgi:cytoplasmic iron level regulating protein YaaA (DUF328/UPF0246 family)